MKKLLTLLICLLPAAGFAQSPADTTVVTFDFLPARDMFYAPWSGNGAELERLYALVDEYRTEITAGALPLYVDGYCASLPTAKENLRTAFVRANRVKSELITRQGLKEEHFITANHARAYRDRKDIVVVTLRIPAKEEPQRAEPVRKEPVQAEPESEEQPVTAQPQPQPQPQPRPQPQPQPQPAPQPAEVAPEPAATAKPYCVAVRTNVLYDALLLPTLGVEWRVNRDIGVKIDGSLSHWGDEYGKVQKIWLVNPEVRWYLLRDKRFYVGASVNVGQYNIYRYPIGSIVSKDTGYQGSVWGAGVTVGYQLPLSRRFSVDFNLGLGYTRFDYDSFVIDGGRFYSERDRSKNFWGPTQTGITLIWTIGGNK